MRDALEALHAQDLAHMDVKPANICFALRGEDFVLIDVGSLAAFGVLTHSTKAFLPREFLPKKDDQGNVKYDGKIRAAAKVDWWMLAVTLMDVASFTPVNVPGKAESFTCEEIRVHLGNPTKFDALIWEELKFKLM
jgi:serine/threonine protein kinase